MHNYKMGAGGPPGGPLHPSNMMPTPVGGGPPYSNPMPPHQQYPPQQGIQKSCSVCVSDFFFM